MSKRKDPAKTSQSIAKRFSTQTGVLLRSRIEIALVLESLLRDACPVYAVVPGAGRDRLFLSRMLYVDPEREFFIVAYGDEKDINAAAIEQESLSFDAHLAHSRIEFSARRPGDTTYQGKRALRLEFPDALARFPRRAHPRYAVPADVSLRCVADRSGVASFEARITDISRGGMGAMVYDPAIRLAPGTILKDCRIVIPQKDAVAVDLEVRYTKVQVLEDGTQVNRSGVRFIRASDQLAKLHEVFMVRLEDQESAASGNPP